MTNRLISEKIVSWDFAPPFDFTVQFLARRASRRGEQTSASPRKKSRSPIWCPQEESNPYYEIRNLASYPLNDEGKLLTKLFKNQGVWQ